jgi:hypothetical protein
MWQSLGCDHFLLCFFLLLTYLFSLQIGATLKIILHDGGLKLLIIIILLEAPSPLAAKYYAGYH